MKVVAVIQARMSSSRLPGKVLMLLAGKPIIWHVVHRLRKCRRVDQVVIATSTNPLDDALEAFGREHGVAVTRGSESDVLDRFWQAAREFDADVVVRVTGDSPVLDPAFVDRLVEALLSSGADHAAAERGVPCIHGGFSPITRAILERLVREAGDDAVAREHVTGYFLVHPEFAHTVYVPVPEDERFDARVSVDTLADMRFMGTIYEHLGVPPGEAGVRDIVHLLRLEPDLMSINAHVRWKHTEVGETRVLIRCDGDERIGLGHVVRCIALADELRERHSCRVTFAIQTGPVGISLLERAGLRAERGPSCPDDEEGWLDALIAQLDPHAVVLDVRTELTKNALERWRGAGHLIVVIDDIGDRRLVGDLVFYPPVPQVERLEWTGSDAEVNVGWEWVLLRRDFGAPTARTPATTARVLVSMGGSDPTGMTLMVVSALRAVDHPLDVTLILGGGFVHHDCLDPLITDYPHSLSVFRSVDDMRSLMGRHDLAVLAMGVTAYEAAAAGLPAIHLCQTSDQEASSSALVGIGAAVSLGLAQLVSEEQLGSAIIRLLGDEELRHRMSAAGRTTVDGRGAARVAGRIVEEARRRWQM